MKRTVFNPAKWGGKDVGDNSQFWERADILREYRDKDGELLADVRWPDGTVSHGHFVSGMKLLWTHTNDPADPCSYCVQWRCSVEEEHDDLNCAWEHEWEPYWPDGSVAARVFDGICDTCQRAISEYVGDLE